MIDYDNKGKTHETKSKTFNKRKVFPASMLEEINCFDEHFYQSIKKLLMFMYYNLFQKKKLSTLIFKECRQQYFEKKKVTKHLKIIY